MAPAHWIIVIHSAAKNPAGYFFNFPFLASIKPATTAYVIIASKYFIAGIAGMDATITANINGNAIRRCPFSK